MITNEELSKRGVRIIRHHLYMECLVCHRTWGASTADLNSLPMGWDICLYCANKKLEEQEKGDEYIR